MMLIRSDIGERNTIRNGCFDFRLPEGAVIVDRDHIILVVARPLEVIEQFPIIDRRGVLGICVRARAPLPLE
jgi:hypothetical protein